MNFKSLCLLIIFLSGCSLIGKNSIDTKILKKNKKNYNIKDLSGDFKIEFEQGYNKPKNAFFTKYQMKTFEENSPIIEQSVTISNPGKSQGIRMLRPEQSEFVVWFDKNKYTSRMKFDSKSKSMIVDLKSPEQRWNGRKIYPLPKTSSIVCYLSQIIPCAAITGFLSKAIDKGVGQMKVLVIFEGFPYFQEQYPGVPNSIYGAGVLGYEGKNAEGEYRFSLEVLDQSIYFNVNKNLDLVKKFWVAQGLSMVETN